MKESKLKKGVVGQTVRLWLSVRRWRWWPTVMMWAAVAGATLASEVYRLWVPAVVKAGSVGGLRVLNDILEKFPDLRWQLALGAILFTAGVGWYLKREGATGLLSLGVALVSWTFGLSARSVYASYVSGGPTAVFVDLLKTVWRGGDEGADALGDAMIQIFRVLYHDILLPNLYLFWLSDWAGNVLRNYLHFSDVLGALLWLLFAGVVSLLTVGFLRGSDVCSLLWWSPVPETAPTPVHPQPAGPGTPADGQASAAQPQENAGPLLQIVGPVPAPERVRPDPRAFEGLVGVGEAVELLKAQVSAWLRPREAAAFGIKPARGILFYGPPGTGKTSLARAAARYFGVSFVSASTPELLSHWIGATEERVRQLFQQARRAAPCIVFLDEIDAVGRRRDDRHLNRPSDLVLPVLLQELDGFRPLEGVLVIAATNRRDVLDEALLRRFTHQIHIGLPDAAGRAELLRRHLKGLATELDFSQAAERLDGFSPADIEAICQRIRQRAWVEKTSGRRYKPVTLADLERELGGRRRWQDDVL